MIIYPAIEKLLYYAQEHLLLDDLDVIYARNLIMDELKLKDYIEYEIDSDSLYELSSPETILEPILNYAVDNGIITADKRDYFSDKIMNIVCLRPSEITDTFTQQHAKNPQKAFDWLYDYALKSDYIKQNRIALNRHWEAKGTKGKIEISINLAKPEKSNAESVKSAEKSGTYPACSICKENEGYSAGTQNRKTLRTIPIELGREDWFWQFSPYSYFNHHGIAVSAEHKPMKSDEASLEKLFDFVDFMPSYFIGCNAALPIIGGSLLGHDHFQGGLKTLPMFKAGTLKKLKSAEYPYIDISLIDWYNSAIRLTYTSKDKLIELGAKIMKAWESYSDKSVNITAKSSAQHNSVTAYARKIADGKYCLELILRNNATSDEFPEGIFHAHPEFLPIKSEAVGLIEAAGLFILPGRLDEQTAKIEKFLTKEVRYSAAKLDADLIPLQPIIEKLVKESGSAKLSPVEAQLNVKDELNRICEKILENSAVFKKDDIGNAAFAKFLEEAGIK